MLTKMYQTLKTVDITQEKIKYAESKATVYIFKTRITGNAQVFKSVYKTT